MNLHDALIAAKQAAETAGNEIMAVRASMNLSVEFKEPEKQSPVTRADKAATRIICEMLYQEFPYCSILTEEELPDSSASLQEAMREWRTSDHTWYIDGLDGTRDFIEGSNEFGIHIGLTDLGKPVLGVNYYPALKTYYLAFKNGGAWKEEIGGTSTALRVSNASELEQMIILVSRAGIDTDPRLQAFFDGHPVKEKRPVGSCGLKMCMVAEGAADLYLMFKPALSLWDTCSGQAIVEAAGGRFTDSRGNRINYMPADGSTKLPYGVIVSNGRGHDTIVKTAQPYLLRSI